MPRRKHVLIPRALEDYIECRAHPRLTITKKDWHYEARLEVGDDEVWEQHAETMQRALDELGRRVKTVLRAVG